MQYNLFLSNIDEDVSLLVFKCLVQSIIWYEKRDVSETGHVFVAGTSSVWWKESLAVGVNHWTQNQLPECVFDVKCR
jgi:hypothetical protein